MSDVFLCFFNHELLNQVVEKFMAEKSGFEKFRVEISFNLIERIHFNPGLFNPRIFNHEQFKNSWLKSPGLKSSWFKSLGLKGQGLKFGVQKSGFKMYFNHLINFHAILKKLQHE